MLVVNKIQHFFSLEPGSGVGKKGETKSLGRGKGSPPNLASLALSSLQPLIFCCCFTSSLNLMKKGKNIQCQCIKLCLNNMLISLDTCRFAIWVQLSEASSKNGYGFYRPIGKNMGWKKVCFDLNWAGSGFGPGRGLPYKSDEDARCFTLGCKLQILVSLRMFGMESYYSCPYRYRKEIYKKCPNTDHTEIPLKGWVKLEPHPHWSPWV